MHKTRAMKTKAGLLKLHSKSKKYGTILNIILNIFYPLANLLHHILKCAHSTKNLKKKKTTHTHLHNITLSIIRTKIPNTMGINFVTLKKETKQKQQTKFCLFFKMNY